MKKKITLTMIIFLMILVICLNIFTIKLFKNKDAEIIKNFLAIVISNDNGIGYKNYEKTTWPDKGYKFKEAKCLDIYDRPIENVVTFNEETRKVSITTNQTVKCTLYFDKPIITYLRNTNFNDTLSKTLIGGMYRYQGVGKEEGIDETHKLVNNNYICFGTDDISKCNCNTEKNCDKYMYRIIGITSDNQLYLIKMNAITDNNTKAFQWNLNYLTDNCVDTKCEWPNSDLYKRINGEGAQINMSNIFINNEEYDYLKEGNLWYEKIDYHYWQYGDIAHILNNKLNDETIYGAYNNGLIVYELETGLKLTQHFEYIENEWRKVRYQWNKKIKAKMGMMYIHDYYLAYDNVTGYLWKDNSNNWINLNNNINVSNSEREWFLPSLGKVNNDSNSLHQYLVYSEGRIDTTEPRWLAAVRPTFYLKNTIRLSGVGTIDNPYIIET